MYEIALVTEHKKATWAVQKKLKVWDKYNFAFMYIYLNMYKC
jgi:hypothetical protein